LLDFTAFVAGFGVMGAEMAAGRLLAPYYGTSNLVWCLLIGSVLSALAVGAYLGGLVSARKRSLTPAYGALLSAGLYLVVVPVIARPMLRSTVQAFYKGNALGLVIGGFAVTLMLALPVMVLGAMSPMLIHHAVSERAKTGMVAGRLGAFSTLGSLLGTFVPGLVLVPLLGTDRCFQWCGALLVGTGLVGLRRRWPLLWGSIGALVVVMGSGWWKQRIGNSRSAVLYEAESRYGYLRVTETGGFRRLYLNDGYAVQTVARLDGQPHLRSVWGYYALAPSFTLRGALHSVLVIGLGGGTSARGYKESYPGARVVGVELDAAVVDVARRYFDLPSSVEVVIDDGRAALTRDPAHYDLIVVDAFQFPYIPFQLATREFFEIARAHLEHGGAFVINVGRNGPHHDVVDAVAATLTQVFPHVNGVDVIGGSNTILAGTEHPLSNGAGLDALGLPADQTRILAALPPLQPWTLVPDALVLTDDLAPVESLTDRIVLRELWRLLSGT
jgi:spermidine synthase